MTYNDTSLWSNISVSDWPIPEVSNMIKSKSSKYDYAVIDLHSHFVNQSGLIKEELTTDGIHLNSNGYKLWADIVKPFVANHQKYF